jgi:hypothetical protein
MTNIIATSWFPILTMVVGFGMSSLSEWLWHRRATQRERDARDAARRDQLFQQRSAFQRETMFELQEAIMQLARATGAIHHQDEMSYRNSQKWQKQLLPNELDEGYRYAQVRTSMLAARIRDDAVRKLVAELRHHSVEITMSATREASDCAMMGMVHMHDELNERIGALLRTLDDADQGLP